MPPPERPQRSRLRPEGPASLPPPPPILPPPPPELPSRLSSRSERPLQPLAPPDALAPRPPKRSSGPLPPPPLEPPPGPLEAPPPAPEEDFRPSPPAAPARSVPLPQPSEPPRRLRQPPVPTGPSFMLAPEAPDAPTADFALVPPHAVEELPTVKLDVAELPTVKLDVAELRSRQVEEELPTVRLDVAELRSRQAEEELPTIAEIPAPPAEPVKLDLSRAPALWSEMPASELPGQWPELPETSPFDQLPLAPPPELDAADLLLGAPNVDADGAPVLEFAADLALGAPAEVEEVDDVFEVPAVIYNPPPPPPRNLPAPQFALAVSNVEPSPALPELEEPEDEPEEPTARQYTYQVGDSLEALARDLGFSKPPPPPPPPPSAATAPPPAATAVPPPPEAPRPAGRSQLRIQPRAVEVALIPRQQPTGWELVSRKLRSWLGHTHARVSAEELAVFTRQMAAMIGAGIPIHQVLTFYAESGEGDLATVIDDVANRVASGTRFSHALRSHPEVFSEVYCALIETGETSSQILEILEKLAELLEKQVRMRKRILSVITYPCILLVVSFAAILGFVYFVLPMLQPLFKDVAMPLPTLILLKLRVAIPVGAFLAVAGALLWWVFKPRWRQYLARSPETRYKLDNFPLSLPVVGKTIEKIVVARVLYSLATMLEAGITIIQALGRCASVAGNAVVARRVYGSIDALVGGHTVAEALGEHKVFPAGCIQLLCAGEEASSLSDTVRYAARFYEEEVELALTDMASMLEPAIMLGMGIIVGFIVLSAVLPTLALLNTL